MVIRCPLNKYVNHVHVVPTKREKLVYVVLMDLQPLVMVLPTNMTATLVWFIWFCDNLKSFTSIYFFWEWSSFLVTIPSNIQWRLHGLTGSTVGIRSQPPVWVQTLEWACLKGVSSFISPHYLCRSLSPFSLACAHIKTSSNINTNGYPSPNLHTHTYTLIHTHLHTHTHTHRDTHVCTCTLIYTLSFVIYFFKYIIIGNLFYRLCIIHIKSIEYKSVY